MGTRRGTVLGAVAAVLAGGSAWGLLQPQSSPEEVKAAFIYQFTRFVEWPDAAFARPGTPWRVGLLGDPPVEEALEHALRGKRIDRRGFEVRRVGAVENLRGCHIVFVPEAEAHRLPQVLEALRGTPALVVGESQGFAAGGGGVGFVLENRKIRLEINLAAATSAGLKVSSKLLQLARVVRSP